MGVHRRIVAVQAVLLAAALTAAALLSTEDQWDPLWLVVVLGAFHVAADAVSMDLPTGRVSANAVPLALTPVLAGPAPAAVTTAVAILVDSLRSRPPLHAAMTNLAGTVGAAVTGGAVVRALTDGGAAHGSAAHGGAVLLAGLLIFALATANLVAAMAASGIPVGHVLRSTMLVVLPWEATAIFVVAAVVLLYDAYGAVALAGGAVFLAALALLLRGIVTAEVRARDLDRVRAERDRLLRDALEAEERERRRVAAELHDDALQTLLAARSDLVEGLAGDDRALASAHDSVAETVVKLRRLMSGLRAPDGDAIPVGAALEDLAIDVERRTGATASVEVDDELARGHDGLLVAVARELLVNVAKHARASTIDVRLERAPGGGVALEVADDGIGVAGLDREALRGDGHLGLSLVEERVGSRGGTFSFVAREGGGTRALVRLPG